MKKQILLVEDDQSLQSALLRQFHRGSQDWLVHAVENGHDAVKLAADRQIDVLITDILMPVTDGLETIKAFRSRHPSVKIIAMSGGGWRMGSEPLEWARLMGADATLCKPFDFADLVAAIGDLLEQRCGTTNSRKGEGS